MIKKSDADRIFGVLDILRQAYAINNKTGDYRMANDRLKDACEMTLRIMGGKDRLQSDEFDNLLNVYASVKGINKKIKYYLGELFTGFVVLLLNNHIPDKIIYFKPHKRRRR